MIYVPGFIKIGSGIQKLRGEDWQTRRKQGDLISLLLFFQIKDSRSKENKYEKKRNKKNWNAGKMMRRRVEEIREDEIAKEVNEGKEGLIKS
jgi:hypothetical protein